MDIFVQLNKTMLKIVQEQLFQKTVQKIFLTWRIYINWSLKIHFWFMSNFNILYIRSYYFYWIYLYSVPDNN